MEPQNEKAVYRREYALRFIMKCLTQDQKDLLLQVIRAHSKERVCTDEVFQISPALYTYTLARLKVSQNDLINRQNKSLCDVHQALTLQYAYPTHDFLLDPETPVYAVVNEQEHSTFWKAVGKNNMRNLKVNDLSDHFPYRLQCAIRYALEQFLNNLHDFEVIPNPHFCHDPKNPPETKMPMFERFGLHLGGGIITNKYLVRHFTDLATFSRRRNEDHRVKLIEYLGQRLEYWRRKTTYYSNHFSPLSKPNPELNLPNFGPNNVEQLTEELIARYPLLPRAYFHRDPPKIKKKIYEMPIINNQGDENVEIYYNQLNANHGNKWRLYNINSKNRQIGGSHYFIEIFTAPGKEEKKIGVSANNNSCMCFMLIRLLHDIHSKYPNLKLDTIDYGEYDDIKNYILTGEPGNVLHKGKRAREFLAFVLQKSGVTDEKKITEVKGDLFLPNDYISDALPYFNLGTHLYEGLDQTPSYEYMKGIYRTLEREQEVLAGGKHYCRAMYEDRLYTLLYDIHERLQVDFQKLLELFQIANYQNGGDCPLYYTSIGSIFLSNKPITYSNDKERDQLLQDHIENVESQYSSILKIKGVFIDTVITEFEKYIIQNHAKLFAS
jgi:hypothetical protein